MKGGNYRADISQNLTILSLNSLYYYSDNPNAVNSTDDA